MNKPIINNPISCIVPDWPAPKTVQAVCTLRQGGVSQSPYNGLNMALHVGDDEKKVRNNRKQAQQQLSLPNSPHWLDQVHSATVIRCGAENVKQDIGQQYVDQHGTGLQRNCPTADASYTSDADTVCAVLTADCLPLLLCDSQAQTVAAIHAGWKGLAAGVIENTIKAMNVSHARLLVWLGPAIGPRAFQVGKEVKQVFVDQHEQAEQAFASHTSGTWLADIYALARIRLLCLGVTQIYGGDRCTYSETEHFYSYRRDKKTGRMASMIWINS